MYTYFLTNPLAEIPELPNNPIVVLTAYPNDMRLDRSPKMAWGKISFRKELSSEDKEKYQLHEGALLGHAKRAVQSAAS